MPAVVFLDRDGTIIEDQHYPKDASLVAFLPRAIEGLRMMKKKGYSLVVVSNQSGVGRGLISDQEFKEVHERTCTLLKAEGIEIEEFFYCLHHPEDPCHCRKPKAGLIPKTLKGQAIDFTKSFTIGDKKSDLALGDTIGTRSFLTLTGKGSETRTEIEKEGIAGNYAIASDLLEIANALPEAF